MGAHGDWIRELLVVEPQQRRERAASVAAGLPPNSRASVCKELQHEEWTILACAEAGALPLKGEAVARKRAARAVWIYAAG